MGELRDPIDRQEQDELAVGMVQFAAVDVDVSDLVALEAFACGSDLRLGQARDAVSLEAAMQCAAAEGGDGVLQAAEHVVEREEGSAAELDDDGLLGWGEDGAPGLFGA